MRHKSAGAGRCWGSCVIIAERSLLLPYPKMERVLTSRKARSHCSRVKLHTCHIYSARAQRQTCFEIKDSVSLESQNSLYFDTILGICHQCNNNYSFKNRQCCFRSGLLNYLMTLNRKHHQLSDCQV